jgi:hypothetical protein
MTVIERNLIDIEYTDTDDGIRSYIATIESISDSKADTPRTVVLDLLTFYPPYFPFPGDGWCRARRPRNVKRRSVDKNRHVWRSQIEYTNRPLKFDQETERGDPLFVPPKISGSFARAMRAATKDREEEPITNSANEPELPAPEVDDSRDTLVIEINTPTIDLALRATFRDKVNHAPHWGLDKRCIKLGQWAYTVEYYNPGLYYIANRFEFEINIEKWDFVRLDMGLRIILGVDPDGNTQYITLMDDVDQPLREPRLLDGEGALLADDADPVILRSEIYEEADFSDLPLPNPLF